VINHEKINVQKGNEIEDLRNSALVLVLNASHYYQHSKNTILNISISYFIYRHDNIITQITVSYHLTFTEAPNYILSHTSRLAKTDAKPLLLHRHFPLSL